MRNGRDALGMIEEHISVAQSRTDAANSRLEDLNRRLAEVRAAIGETARRLARFRLDELGANQVIAHLDATDQAVVALLKHRSQALEETKGRLAASVEKQAGLKAAREKSGRTRDELIRQLDDTAAGVKAALGQQEAYRDQARRAAEAAARVVRARAKTAQAEADRGAKGKPYEDDPLFMYLWRRRFLTPDYKAGVLTRTLDAWVAKMIRFDEARGNYHMLTQLPAHLKAHAERQEALAAEEERKLRAMVAEALEGAGFAERKQALDASQKTVEELEAEIEAEEKRYQILLQERDAFAAGADALSREAMDLQVAEITKGSIAQLYMEAKMTAKPDDDVIVSQMRDLQGEEKKLEDELARIQAEAGRSRDTSLELEELRRRFRENQYDSGHSLFPEGFDLGTLLGMLLSGAAGGGDVWDQIKSRQQFRRPRTPENFGGGLFPRGIGRGAGRGDPPRGRNRFGGGGFRTGGRM